MALIDAYGRLARLLLDLAVKEDGHLLVSQPMTHRQIAERVTRSPETISRIM